MQAPAQQVTEAHLRQAFEAMHWVGWTYEAAMASDTRRRLVECRAHLLRTREQEATRQPTTQCVRRVVLDEHGQVAAWRTQTAPGPRADAPQLALPLTPT